MKLKNIADAIQHGIDLLKGEDTLDKIYRSDNTLSDERTAHEAFVQAKERLFAVNRWSDISSITANFSLHDSAGQPKPEGQPVVGDYINIVLPAPPLENWVKITRVSEGDTWAEFVVHPSSNPNEKSNETEHFLTEESSSTFRVEVHGNTVTATEFGKNERANNQEESGGRGAVNTVVAGTGWLFYQTIQWKTLTDYLVGL
ncbi:hypothetical protein ACFQ4C_09550 [Larkinella insperata]|uniref:DUF2314 domain-containing protein n=1 Tax=Larkinella insperata TaxID=332158 RepID=A0ABW3Q4E4_9BACT|nr:hypothetical protein [Larkinella insperata]